MQGPLSPFRGVGPVTPPLTTEPGVRGAPDLVPIVDCGVNAQGQRFVNISVRNEGAEPARRRFWTQFFISGLGFISGQVPIDSLRPGQQVLVESSADDVLQGINRLVIFVDVDLMNQIPEEINKGNNRLVTRCFAMPIVQSPLMRE